MTSREETTAQILRDLAHLTEDRQQQLAEEAQRLLDEQRSNSTTP